ncbi:MAG: transglycosylase SLT domain-containing protein [Gammaproteobacteria bacterium]|nr:transglycosylase SLT domain-containing protein [Gammaproteobacteria bacterium]
MIRILTTATVFCNRQSRISAHPFCQAGARPAISTTNSFALAFLILGLAGCMTVETPSEVDPAGYPPADAAPVKDTRVQATPDALIPTDSVATPTDTSSPTPEMPSPSPAEPATTGDPGAVDEAVTIGFLDRLRASFRLDHSLDRKGVAKEVSWMARRPDRLARRDRLLEYLPYLCEKVWDRGLPGEICLLPIVESRLDPFAFSPGGAVGLWQFIPATAKRFGLKIDWWVDERRDVVLATDAALNYLEELHDRFGDWLLALAAYNWGEGNVSRAIRRSGPNAGFFDIRVPRETVRYVDRLLAYSAVFAHPASFGIELPLSNPEAAAVSFAVVDTGGQVDLARAAEALGCDLDEIYRRNPALNRWATHPEGPHRLLVSAGSESTAEQALAQIPEKERLAWVRHLVVSGETLSKIALAYRTSTETLQHANRLQSTLIRAGDYLLVPTTHRPLEDYARYSRPLAGRPAGVYVVKAGDTIWDIARLLGLKRQTLMNANQIGPNDILRIGQRLSIP